MSGAESRCPAWLLELLRAFDGERIGRDILCDNAAGARIGAIADFHRRDERRVRADERARADIGEMLAEAVIIAGDGARADIRMRADARIADIREVIDLRT